MPRLPRLSRRLSRLLLPAVVCGVLLAAGLPGLTRTAAAAIDDYAGYDGQSSCAKEVLPGTAFLLRHLVRTHPGSRSVSTLRACSSTTTSEHQDGRALDWGLDAGVPKEKATAEAWLKQVFATDARGNTHALARRMGIMYIIWDRHIYSAYGGFEKREYGSCARRPASCSETTAHRDHVHISLSRGGAAAQTSFYRNRNVPSVPVLYPRTLKLDPVSTAEVRFEVPATGRLVTTDFKLAKGVSYRLVADGLVRTGAGTRIADAACTWTRDGWTPRAMLRVDGTNPWAPACNTRHTYETTYTPTRTDFLKLRVPVPDARQAEGSFTFSILREDFPARTVATPRPAGRAEPRPARRGGPRGRLLVKEQVTVPARAGHGRSTQRALRPGKRYRVVVTGKAASGATAFDGRCVRYAGAWRPQHTLDLTDPTADHLAVYVQGVKVDLRVPGSTRPCNGGAHRYVGVIKAVTTGRARVKVWDPYRYDDNSGSLSVLLRRL